MKSVLVILCFATLVNARVETVVPEGKDGWYTDSAMTATDKYESYILKELIPDVEKRFRTIETCYGRAIFYFHCGTEDAPFIFNSNREIAALMTKKKIPHEFRELPGDHSWGYWDRQVREVLKVAAEKMRLPPKRISRA